MRLFPPHYFLLAIVLMVLLAVTLDSSLIPWPWNLAGIPLFLIGLWLALAAHGRFVSAGTPVKPFERSTALVVEGPFRFSRNPMYLGMLLVLVGLAVTLAELLPLLVPAVFWAIVRFRFIGAEERMMFELFGEDYGTYQQRVRRWI